MESSETTAASSEDIHVPERVIPAPKSISAKAQAALNAVRPTAPPYPEVDDKPAWRDFVGQFNANLVETIREQIVSVPGRVAQETIAGVPVYVAEPESIPSGNRDKAMVFFTAAASSWAGAKPLGFLLDWRLSRPAVAFTQSTLATRQITPTLAPSTMALRSTMNC